MSIYQNKNLLSKLTKYFGVNDNEIHKLRVLRNRFREKFLGILFFNKELCRAKDIFCDRLTFYFNILNNSSPIFVKKSVIFILKTNNVLVSLIKKILGTKTILLVSKERIRSYSISPLKQLLAIFTLVIIGNIFVRSFHYHSIIDKKSAEIMNLKDSNHKFEIEIETLNSNLQKVNDYFTSVSGYQATDSSINNQKNINKKIESIFGGLHLDKDSQQIAAKIANSGLILDQIRDATTKRIVNLEDKLAIAGIGFNDGKAFLINNPNDNNGQEAISLNSEEELLRNQGGPFLNLQNKINNFTGVKIFNPHKQRGIKNEIEYLSKLEKFIRHVPLTSPIKNYYVSSRFGTRSDPIKGSSAKHEGIDFVGQIGSSIFSPSPAKVIFAGKFGTYGNTLILDHGYGITTRYGHLSKFFVNKGDRVLQNQTIATQGNTGRSTGQHLHYEIRYKNIPLNPKKFLQAGQEIMQ